MFDQRQCLAQSQAFPDSSVHPTAHFDHHGQVGLTPRLGGEVVDDRADLAGSRGERGSLLPIS